MALTDHRHRRLTCSRRRRIPSLAEVDRRQRAFDAACAEVLRRYGLECLEFVLFRLCPARDAYRKVS
jgi:hypothetical protein